MLRLLLVGFLAILALLILFLLQFYRNPKRLIPKEKDAIVSPADGVVMGIFRTSEKEVLIKKGILGKIRSITQEVGKECVVVSIFMSPFDVHINRAPIEGKIVSAIHSKGKFFAASDFKKSLENEKNEIVMEGKVGGKKTRIKIIQVAGFLARRIVCDVKKEDLIEKGQRVGMIRLSSQTNLIMPSSVNLSVKVGEKVKAGSSIVARMGK